jgi:A/G-specific adenine glycosylase
VLVSEAMLQQTQVATVIPYFHRFIERFPTIEALASADERQVLRLWQGLGYYSRARNLHAAAKTIVRQCAGRLPRSVDGLLELPGVGRYTACAIASLAFDEPAAVVDGNVTRVLARLDAVEDDPRTGDTRGRLWERAQELLARRRPGDFNSAMMELGAIVCKPSNPRCPACPVRRHCQARAAGLQERIPVPRTTRVRPVVRRWAICVRDRSRWLIEQRPARGRWAGMWQFVTLAADGRLTSTRVTEATGLKTTRPRRLGAISHGLTHRQYEFEVYACERRGGEASWNGRPRAWVTLQELSDYPLPRPHVRIATTLAAERCRALHRD